MDRQAAIRNKGIWGRMGASTIVAAAMVVDLAGPAVAGVDVYGRVEPSLPIPLTAPQSDRFNPGFHGIADGGVKLGWVDLKLTAQLLVLTARTTTVSQENAVAGAFGGGARLRAPDALMPRLAPWLDLDLLYVRTSSLNRFGYSVAAGMTWPLDFLSGVRLGPVVRFSQILDSSQLHFDSRDAYLLSLGLSLEFDQEIGARSIAHNETAEVK